jgi:multimeric flavodoxin WrbA
MKQKILIINGSANLEKGQSYLIAQKIQESYTDLLEIEILTLTHQVELEKWQELIRKAQGFIFLSGTYWDSWGSPLQLFLEKTTHWEASSLWLGKPAAVIITMHSVGGKAILSRLQGVLNTMGVLIPPFAGLVYSLNTHLIKGQATDHQHDFWQLEEIDLMIKNLQIQMKINASQRPDWQAWQVDRADVSRPWLKAHEIKLGGSDQKP